MCRDWLLIVHYCRSNRWQKSCQSGLILKREEVSQRKNYVNNLSAPLLLLSINSSSPADFRYRVINDMTITAAMVPKTIRPIHMNNIGFHDDINLEK